MENLVLVFFSQWFREFLCKYNWPKIKKRLREEKNANKWLGYCINLGPWRSRPQDGIRHVRRFCGEGTGEDWESLLAMTQVWHLGKEEGKERGLSRKNLTVVQSEKGLALGSRESAIGGTLCLSGMACIHSPHCAQSLARSSSLEAGPWSINDTGDREGQPVGHWVHYILATGDVTGVVVVWKYSPEHSLWLGGPATKKKTWRFLEFWCFIFLHCKMRIMVVVTSQSASQD